MDSDSNTNNFTALEDIGAKGLLKNKLGTLSVDVPLWLRCNRLEYKVIFV